MTSGHHTMATAFKGTLDIILWLLKAIDKIHPAVSLLILTLPISGKMFTKLAVEGQAALTKLSSKFTELITKVRAFTLSMRGASNATSAMGATATTSVGAVGRAVSALEKAHWILAAIGVAYQLYQSYVESANEKEAEHIDTLNKEVEVYDEQLKRMEEAYPLIERMTNTYNSLAEKRKDTLRGQRKKLQSLRKWIRQEKSS